VAKIIEFYRPQSVKCESMKKALVLVGQGNHQAKIIDFAVGKRTAVQVGVK
jgi:hypothetical protein